MKAWFLTLSIRAKLRLSFVLVSGVLIGLMAVAYATFEIQASRDAMSERYSRVAAMVGTSSRAAVAFSDAQSAERVVEGVMSSSGILDVFIIDSFGMVLAHSNTAADPDPLELLRFVGNGEVVEFAPDKMIAARDIVLDGDGIGTVVVYAGYEALTAAQRQMYFVVAGAFAAAMLLAMLFSLPFEKMLSAPIVRLAEEMATVSQDKDFSRRVAVASGDEIGDLYSRFNVMLEEVQSRDHYIEGERARLESEVAARTIELTDMNAELEANNEELRVASVAALAAARSKAEFLANMSHEIRTPMNGVLGMLELVRDTPLDSEQQDYIETAFHSGHSLLSLINDILDLSKIEAGKMSMEIQPVVPSELVEDVCALVHQQAAAKRIDLVGVLEPACYERYGLDPTRVRQILLNLVGNAVKFTDEGSVTVRGDVITHDDQEMLELVVEDTGIGISEAAQIGLFEAFTQADGSTTRRFGGTGLGLTITQHLIELMHGDISVESEEDVGSKFRVRIPVSAVPRGKRPDSDDLKSLRVALAINSVPLRKSLIAMLGYLQLNHDRAREDADVVLTDDAGLAAREDQRVIVLAQNHRGGELPANYSRILKPVRINQLMHGLRGTIPAAREVTNALAGEYLIKFPRARVLLAEDNPVNQLVASKMLRGFGIEADLAQDGEEVLAQVEKQAYDLILMDCQMPNLDGYAATAGVRRWEIEQEQKRTPIIALTANAMEGDREQCLAAGMDDYLPKPLERKRLGAALQRWLVA